MKILKRILIFLIIITIIVAAILVYLLKMKKVEINNESTNNVSINNAIQNTNPNIEYEDTQNINTDKVELVDNRNKYYAVSDIINSYTNNNYIINQMFILKKKTHIDIFWIDTVRKDTNKSNNFIVITDSLNNTFLIFDQGYISKENYTIENLSNIDINEIEYKDNNKFEYKNINDETYASELLKSFIQKNLNDSQLGYNALNEDYKEKKFPTLNDYEMFFNKNREMFMLYDAKNIKQYGEFESYEEWNMYFSTIKLLELDKYLIKERDGYTEYTLIDTYGNYYIFNEKSVMNYEVILDTYTIDLPEFVEKYNEVDEKGKVELNITRFFEAIKSYDYEYLYNKLDNNFKLQYFSTIEVFEDYVKNTLVHDEFSFNNFSELDGIYTYTIELENGENIIEKSFTVELLEGTDYRISFNID